MNPFSDFSVDDLYAYLGSYSLTRRPGVTFEYSNLGLGLLGHALALQAGTSYETALRDRVLQPLGLDDTTIVPSEEQLLRRATGHHGVVPRPPFEMDSLLGAGSLLSTVSDLLTFLEYQMGIRMTELSSVIAETQKTHFASVTSELSIGLGWFLLANGSIQITMHDGATMGQTAFAGLNRRTKVGVVVLTNARINEYTNIQDIGLSLLEPALPLNPIVRPATVPPETLREYVGVYEEPGGTSFRFEILHDHLSFAFSEDQGAVYTLFPSSSRRFVLRELGIEASALFNRDSTGQTTSMTWRQSGQSTIYTKQITPPQLTLRVVGDKIQLSLSGDVGVEYIIEATNDLKNWLPIATVAVGDDPFEEPLNSGVSQQFYQARLVE